MSNQRRRGAVLVVIVVTAGCGGGGDDTSFTTSVDTEAPSATATDETQAEPTSDGGDTLTPDMCVTLGEDESSANLADVVPSAYANVAQLLSDLSASFETDEPMSAELIDRFVDPNISAEFASFADALERDCPPSEASDGVRAYAGMAEIAAVQADSDYCKQLAIALSLDAGDDESASALEVAISLAPGEHAQALATLQALMSAEDGIVPEGIDQNQTFAATAGLGLYAEARCGVADAFGTMLLAAVFLSMSGDTGGFNSTPATGLGMTPTPADPTAAMAAAPATFGLTFEVAEIDLEDDGDYLVSAVVPTGWERDDSFFGTVFEPPDDFGFFTKFTLDTGCDGMCEATDWDARLNGTDGFITHYRESGDLIVDRATTGTPGVVLAKPGFSDGIEGRVIRWDDATDRYFVCEFKLDDDDVSLVDAFVAACEASQPGWISRS